MIRLGTQHSQKEVTTGPYPHPHFDGDAQRLGPRQVQTVRGRTRQEMETIADIVGRTYHIPATTAVDWSNSLLQTSQKLLDDIGTGWQVTYGHRTGRLYVQARFYAAPTNSKEESVTYADEKTPLRTVARHIGNVVGVVAWHYQAMPYGPDGYLRPLSEHEASMANLTLHHARRQVATLPDGIFTEHIRRQLSQVEGLLGAAV